MQTNPRREWCSVCASFVPAFSLPSQPRCSPATVCSCCHLFIYLELLFIFISPPQQTAAPPYANRSMTGSVSANKQRDLRLSWITNARGQQGGWGNDTALLVQCCRVLQDVLVLTAGLWFADCCLPAKFKLILQTLEVFVTKRLKDSFVVSCSQLKSGQFVAELLVTLGAYFITFTFFCCSCRETAWINVHFILLGLVFTSQTERCDWMMWPRSNKRYRNL